MKFIAFIEKKDQADVIEKIDAALPQSVARLTAFGSQALQSLARAETEFAARSR